MSNYLMVRHVLQGLSNSQAMMLRKLVEDGVVVTTTLRDSITAHALRARGLVEVACVDADQYVVTEYEGVHLSVHTDTINKACQWQEPKRRPRVAAPDIDSVFEAEKEQHNE